MTAPAEAELDWPNVNSTALARCIDDITALR
jgi:hypothetical protein